jgi:hypothetical protein
MLLIKLSPLFTPKVFHPQFLQCALLRFYTFLVEPVLEIGSFKVLFAELYSGLVAHLRTESDSRCLKWGRAAVKVFEAILTPSKPSVFNGKVVPFSVTGTNNWSRRTGSVCCGSAVVRRWNSDKDGHRERSWEMSLLSSAVNCRHEMLRSEYYSPKQRTSSGL